MRAVLVLALPLLLPGPARAEPATRASASSTDSLVRGRALLESGSPQEAITILKEGIDQHPEKIELRWLLTRAYLKDGNDFWALRTLAAIAELDPRDCEPDLWMAWVYLKQGAPEEARARLVGASCRSSSPSETRRLLLFSMLEQNAGQQGQASRYLAAAREAEQVYEEDRPAMEHLTRGLDPGYITPLVGKLDLSAGWASNALAGSPADPAAMDTDGSSPAGQLKLWLRFVAPTGRWLRPSVEAEARALGYAAESGRDLSYLMMGARPGVQIAGSAPNAVLAYRFESLLIGRGDRYDSGPLWLYNTHRLELEASPVSSLSLFGGVGRRLFREAGRSRTEVDGGAGGSAFFHQKLRTIGALTARWHDADNSAYDLWGGTALVSNELRLPKEWALRLGGLVGLDWYPLSAGYFDTAAADTVRQDILLKISLSGISPTFEGIKGGLTYEYTRRFSTTTPYDYRDHRVLLKLIYTFVADPWAPASVSPEGHVPLDHGLAATGFEERLQELLRQDEVAQQGSSCVE